MTLRVPTDPPSSGFADWARKAANAINATISGLTGKQPLADNLTSIAGLDLTGHSGDAIVVVAGEDGFELAAGAGGGGTTDELLTFNNGGAGAASGATFDGSAPITVSHNTVGAAASTHTHAQADVTNLVSDLAGKQPLDATLTALAAHNTNGLLTQSAADTFTGRAVAVSGFGLAVANGDGVAGNPTLSKAFSGALVHKSADETAANYSAGALVAWDSEANGYDTDGYHDTATNNSRLTIPANGKYVFRALVEVTNLASADYVRCRLEKNGVAATVPGGGADVSEVSSTPAAWLGWCSAPLDCVATDYFQVWLDTESDTSVTVAKESWFSVERVT